MPSKSLKKISEHMRIGKGFAPTEKIMIIGASGTGKTELAFDLAFWKIKPYNGICYISPTNDDRIVQSFEVWCKKAGIRFEHFMYDSKDKSMALPRYINTLYIIDDYYTSVGRPALLEKFVSELINRGRHDGNHIIYIAQSSDRLPSEWWKGVKVCIKHPDEKVFEKTGSSLKDYEDSGCTNPDYSDYWKIGPILEGSKKIWKILDFEEPAHSSHIIQNLKIKKVNDAGIVGVPANLETYNGAANAGNKTAKKTEVASKTLLSLIK